MTLRHRSFAGVAMLAATAIAWGGMFPVLKPLLSILDPITLTLIRFGLATPILVALLLVIEGRSALAFDGRALRLWWLGTLGFAGFGLLLVIGLRMTQPQHAAVMPALMPLITVIITAIRSRSLPTGRGLFAVLVGLAGVVLVVTAGHPAVLLQGSVGGGEALVLAGATCWVLYTLGAAGFPGWSGLRYTTLTLMLGTLTIVGVEMVALATGHAAIPDRAAFGRAAPGMAYMVLAASVMGFLFWNAGMRALGPRMGVLFINLVPVTAFAIALIGGQIPSPWEVAGVALVIAALMLNSFGGGRTVPAAPGRAAG
ncbi:EamA-like transporter family protein [Paracoccus versutus]|uniref:EamA-like transporter family protein n=1 Tax=Paracoccus versutus TaxID=34007 RepID=A0AAQ0HCS2_PARVE|nr:DMT family transporter [Paracoccus versutus]REG28344.1 EamA-like transporter family protein [Paracoccus versutus]